MRDRDGKQQQQQGKVRKKGAQQRLTRFGGVLKGPLDVMAASEGGARLVAVRRAVDAPLDAGRPAEILRRPQGDGL